MNFGATIGVSVVLREDGRLLLGDGEARLRIPMNSSSGSGVTRPPIPMRMKSSTRSNGFRRRLGFERGSREFSNRYE
jgi:hypothetical protein